MENTKAERYYINFLEVRKAKDIYSALLKILRQRIKRVRSVISHSREQWRSVVIPHTPRPTAAAAADLSLLPWPPPVPAQHRAQHKAALQCLNSKGSLRCSDHITYIGRVNPPTSNRA